MSEFSVNFSKGKFQLLIKNFLFAGFLNLLILFLIPSPCLGQHFVERRYVKGLNHAINGNFREAKKEFKEGLNLAPNFEQFKQGLKIIDDVLQQRIKTQTAIHLFKSANYANFGFLDKSIAEDEKAIKLNPNYAIAYNSLATGYIQKLQHDKAVHYLNKAIELDSASCETYVLRGHTFLLMKQYEKAIKDFNQAIEISPGEAGIYYNRALANFFKGDYRKASKDAKYAKGLGYPVPWEFLEKIRQSLNRQL